MAEKFIGDYINQLPQASESEIKAGHMLVRTASGEMKQAPGNKLGEKAVFEAIYGVTTYADIEQAIADGYCVKCDASGYTYELVEALSDKITFALTNNVNGSIAQETVWVTSDNEWDGESVNVAKAADIPENAVSSTDVTAIVKVFALPENPDPNTLYLVIEEDAAAASETEVE